MSVLVALAADGSITTLIVLGAVPLVTAGSRVIS
jgi:hypothetical protein